MGGYKKADGSTGFLMADGSVNTTQYLKYIGEEKSYIIGDNTVKINSTSIITAGTTSLTCYIYFLCGVAVGGCLCGRLPVACWNNATVPIKSSASVLGTIVPSTYWPRSGPINLCHLKQVGNKSNNTFSAWLDNAGYIWTQGSNYDITDASNPYYYSSTYRNICGYWTLFNGVNSDY
jgi:hypothetical protein